ncbi:MAG: hypothetical protein AAB489_05105 [Patescibacteria group bacterium]
MRARLLLLQAILLFYLAITIAGFLFTMLRIRLPLPWVLVRFSYNMMAPYQGDTDINEEMVAEGLRNSFWEPIDLNPYFPVGAGEKNVRMYLRSFRSTEDQRAVGAYTDFAVALLERERANGHQWKEVRLTWEEWPRSPLGFSALRKMPDLIRTPIVTVQ